MPGLTRLPGLRGDPRAARDVPVMMLTVRGEEEDLVRALELGADDYLTKPFSPRTLLARVKALLRRAGMENGRAARGRARHARSRGAHACASAAATPVRLTKLELRLLQMLLANAGHTVSSDRLLVQVWGHRSSRRPPAAEAARAPPAAEDRARPGRAAAAADRGGAGYKLVVD